MKRLSNNLTIEKDRFGKAETENFKVRSGAMMVGGHIIAELYGVEQDLISKEDKVKAIMLEVVENSGLTIIGSLFKQFEPYGVSGVILISESHVSIHTWPEYSLVNLDIFTCGEQAKAERVFELFLERFKPKSFKRHAIDRG